VQIPLAVINRHGLVAGATGTGKTKTLQLMAEQLAQGGVPVFLADIKGDLSGMASPGVLNDKIAARAQDIGEEWVPTAYPTEFYCLGGQGKGIPIRAAVSSFGPTLLAKVLGLNETQESSLGLVFHYADKKGCGSTTSRTCVPSSSTSPPTRARPTSRDLGGLSSATAGVILRELITFADQGADVFFGLPEFDTADLLRVNADGRGTVSMLELPAVQDRPQLFSTFLMWLLADLFHDLPEVGDLDKPKLVFFFDEAHLLFADASKDFLQAITQTVRLIRSKGVGVFFVTQSPKDVPADVLAQLGNRVQHALRAFTPDDAKALKAAVSTYPKSAYDLEELLTQLGTGEAVITVLSERGAPTPVAWTRMRAPQSLMAPFAGAAHRPDRRGVARHRGMPRRRTASRPTRSSPRPRRPPTGRGGRRPRRRRSRPRPRRRQAKAAEAAAAKAAGQAEPGCPSGRSGGADGRRAGRGSSVFKSMLRSAGTVIGREITRSIFGTSRRR
jgi:DNA helicase HerA-like ATPase